MHKLRPWKLRLIWVP